MKHYSPAALWKRRFWILFAIIAVVVLLPAAYLALRFLPDRPVTYSAIEDHFKYGSTGGERESGFPYWIWQAMPKVCAHHLPKNGASGYEAFGMIYEKGKDLPIGVMKRRNLGLDRVFLNCAVCHASTVRENPKAEAQIYLGMPAARLDLMAFEKFVFGCAADEKFRAEYIVPEIQHLSGKKMSLLDRQLVYPAAIAIMRERLLMLKSRFAASLNGPAWGPGRVDTFNSAKVLFNFPLDKLPAHELVGASDFPSVWNQRPRTGMQLHWDGNNTMVQERNKSAAFGTGTTPPTIDLEAIGRLEAWLLDLKAPPYPFMIDQSLAARGAPIYKHYCAACHGANGQDFGGEYVGKVTPIADIGTDRGRLDSYTYDLAVNQATLYAGYPWRFQNFRKTFGYANMPLDGLWLRAPYLHNGSVPTLRDLLEPSANRPKTFFRGYDVYDQTKVGFVGTVAENGGHEYFRYDTSQPGNGNRGHEGKAYGTQLSSVDKNALVEYLKTF